MILQALTRYYENLLRRGEIAGPGWETTRVSFGLNLGDGGEVLSLLPLEQEQMRENGTVMVPQICRVPARMKRASGIAANFLCDHAGYFLGVDGKNRPKRTQACYAASRTLHLELLGSLDIPAARAVCAYFKR